LDQLEIGKWREFWPARFKPDHNLAHIATMQTRLMALINTD